MKLVKDIIQTNFSFDSYFLYELKGVSVCDNPNTPTQRDERHTDGRWPTAVILRIGDGLASSFGYT